MLDVVLLIAVSGKDTNEEYYKGKGGQTRGVNLSWREGHLQRIAREIIPRKDQKNGNGRGFQEKGKEFSNRISLLLKHSVPWLEVLRPYVTDP